MKKTLLISAALVIGAAGFAQDNRNAATLNRPVSVKENSAIETETPSTNTKSIAGSKFQQSSNALCTPKRFTSAPNSFAVGGGVTTFHQNCLSYNKDLNAILWTSRPSQEWAFSGKTSGAIQSTWLNITTGVWDSMIIYRDSANTLGATNAHAARYPGGTIFNPTGNTAIAGSYMVGSGSVTGGTGWLGEWYSVRQPSGSPSSYHGVSAALDDQKFCANGKSPFGNLGNSSTNVGFMNLDMQQVGQKVMVAGAMWDYTKPTSVKGAIIAKGTYATGNFTWTADSSLIPGFYNSATQGLIGDGQGARLAFDAAGQIGYAVFVGRLSTNYNNSADSTMMPIVYKTTDGGNTWSMKLAGYDWRKGHPELLKNVGTLKAPYRAAGYKATRFTPYLRHGVDLTVDANGVLHYVTTFIDPYLNGRVVDSLQYTYTYNWDYKKYHPIIWDLMTDGTCWKTTMVDSIITSYVGGDPANDTTATYNAWKNGATYMPYGAHLTISRSTDGTKIFYGWGDSDPLSTGTIYNNAPDMIIKGLDVNAKKLTALTNVTNGIGACFFSYLSDVSYFDAVQSKWVVPFVYTVGRAPFISPGVYNGLNPVDYYYGGGNCSAFGVANFTFPAVFNNDLVSTVCTIGIESNTNAFVNSVSNYPNPFNHTTNIVVNLNESKAINLQVFDAIGNIVFAKNISGNIGENTIVFDAATVNAGVYYYTVTAGYDRVTKKMVVQK